MYEKFTDRARQVILLAHGEALDHGPEPVIDTQHALLGLVQEGEGLAAKVLADEGIALPELREEMRRQGQLGSPRETSSTLPMTQGTKRIVEHALEEARKLGHNYAGTEHLLLALTREAGSQAVQILERRGVSTDGLRKRVLEILGHFDDD